MQSNILNFCKIISEVHRLEPVVEFGSAQIKGHRSPRDFWDDCSYTGCDLTEADGVDRIEDITASSFKSNSIGTLLACSTLEHVQVFWQAFIEMRRLLRYKGLLIISVPFSFPMHWLPDYWRFTPQAIDWLLSIFERRHVFFQGPIYAPHTIMAIAGKSKSVEQAVYEYLTQEMCRVPGLVEGEKIFEYSSQEEYMKQWRELAPNDEGYKQLRRVLST
jgi:hypothetical protein